MKKPAGVRDARVLPGDEIIAAVKVADPPDVVLPDVMMPGMNGIETLKGIKTAKADVQVIMLSGREQASTIVEAVRLGAADYVVKPDDPGGLGEIALESAIKSAIEKTRLVSEITELRSQLTDDQVQWNRRRAAGQLGVSYKTLLNKIKECGIGRA